LQPAAERIERHETLGFTSTHILTEVSHRIMTIEAIAIHGWPPAAIAPRLRRHPALVQQLTGFQQAIDDILQSKIQVLPIPIPLIASAVRISRQTGLLSNDALIVAVMRHQGLSNLASNDGDFDRVPGLTRYAPV
jgi:predicted nucleic acid-binding protein